MSHVPAIRTRLIIVAALLGASATGAATGPDSIAFSELLRRAHAYVVVYEDHELSAVIARERYYQQWLNAKGRQKGERTLVSDFLLLQLPPDEDWFALRDVLELDGVPVADRTARRERLLAGPQQAHDERVTELLNESARFNLAPDLYQRTMNVPTFPLRFLRPASRSRFTYRDAGQQEIEGITTSIVDYVEAKGPTFSGTPEGRDLPARGRFWIDPETGAVVRSEMLLGGSRRMPARVTITVTYAMDPVLGFRVPVEMLERYDNPRLDGADIVVAHATYSEFRKCRVIPDRYAC